MTYLCRALRPSSNFSEIAIGWQLLTAFVLQTQQSEEPAVDVNKEEPACEFATARARAPANMHTQRFALPLFISA